VLLWFLGYCVWHWILEDKVSKRLFSLARGCLHRLRMKVIGHGDGSWHQLMLHQKLKFIQKFSVLLSVNQNYLIIPYNLMPCFNQNFR
jgi:hypothetical protein